MKPCCSWARTLPGLQERGDTSEAELDSSRFPLLVTRWDGPESDEAVEQFIAALDGLSARAIAEGVHYTAVNIGDGDLSAKQRKRLVPG